MIFNLVPGTLSLQELEKGPAPNGGFTLIPTNRFVATMELRLEFTETPGDDQDPFASQARRLLQEISRNGKANVTP